jgi:hypothetical protein
VTDFGKTRKGLDMTLRHAASIMGTAMSTNAGEVPMMFLRIGWMDRYRGQTSDDQISGGGAYVREHGFGHEIMNFLPHDRRVYGYVQPRRTAYNSGEGAGIKLERLGATSDVDFLSGVLAIWIATSPLGGSFIVGWYQNATIFRHWQTAPTNSGRLHEGVELGYYVTAAANDAVLLRPDERVFSIPRGRGGMGQANVWYADDPPQHTEFRASVLEYVNKRVLPNDPDAATHDTPRQTDPFRRQEIERAAITATAAYYTALGYVVDSVEKDNVGWDLEANHDGRQLRLLLEVKGLSGPIVSVDLTPNEYRCMREHRESYRLCVVTEALTASTLSIFQFSNDSNQWEDQHGRALQIQTIESARCSA